MSFQDKILHHFQLTPADYQTLIRPVTVNTALDLSLFPILPTIVEAIKKGIANNESFLIYGDYDADGMLATAIMVRTLKMMGANVSSYLPSRYMDGYGIQAEKIERIAQKKFKWLITVDNGISALEAIQHAVEQGIQVIVTDHHQIGSQLPHTSLILHPLHQTSNQLPMCGSAMALYVSAALLGRVDDLHAVYAGIATLADYMPLTGLNRNLVRYALKLMNTQSFATITRLIGNDPIDEVSLNMKWIPMVNSIGRIVENQNINRMTPFLITEDEEERFLLADWIKTMYAQRKEISKKALEGLSYDANQPALVLKTSEKEGIVGLLATRLGQETKKPVFILSDSNHRSEGYVGSSRALESQSVLLALQSVEPTLIRFGGHHGAAGFEVKKDQFERFKEGILDYYRQQSIDHHLPKQFIIPLFEHEFSLANYAYLEALKPFGRSFPAPLFQLTGVETQPLKFIKEGTILSHLWKGFKLFSFQLKFEDLHAYDRVDLIGEFRMNYYLGNKEIQFLVLDFVPSLSSKNG